jgi:hypothetical protein
MDWRDKLWSSDFIDAISSIHPAILNTLFWGAIIVYICIWIGKKRALNRALANVEELKRQEGLELQRRILEQLEQSNLSQEKQNEIISKTNPGLN